MRPHGLWLGLLAAVALAGCELPQAAPGQPPPPPASATDPGPAAPTSVPGPPAAKPTPPPLAQPARPSVEPQALVGLGEDEITRMLGEPREVRNDPPAMVWNYAATTAVSSCSSISTSRARISARLLIISTRMQTRTGRRRPV